MSSYTPAPWFIDPNVKKNANYIDISSQEHIGLATAVWRMDGDERTPECEANARLIAAAPEMYDIILDIAGYKLLDGEYPLEAEVLNKMADILAKIRGEE